MKNIVYFLALLGLAVAFTAVSPANAQDHREAVVVIERMDAGHSFYEIVGTGFPTGRRVRIEVINVAIHQGNTFVVTAADGGFSGVFIGKTPAGENVPVTPGAWKVRAKCGSVTARAEFTVQEGRGMSAGEWGGRSVGLVVTSTGATLDWDCANGTIDQPIVLDESGHFDVTGVHVREHGGPIRQGERDDAHPARYTGTVDSGTMLLTVTLTDTNESMGTYTLTLGVAPQIFRCL